MFTDRAEAGIELAKLLTDRHFKRPLILALPRGGVPVGFEVARALHAPLDTLVVRKVGTPFNPEFAVGAIAPHDVFVLDEESLRASGASQAAVEGIVGKARMEMRRRSEEYRSGKYSAAYVPGTVLLVDDGMATGLTARAACEAARKKYPKAKIVIAAPVCIGDSAERLSEYADEVLCIKKRSDLYAVGQAYENFEQVSDTEVKSLLSAASGVSS
ncbi:MAG: phosphoribosyltransferase family protein [Candidatus Paceibacterota bacterium]